MLRPMQASSASSRAVARLGSRRPLDRLGDRLLYAFTGAAALGAIVLVGLLVYKVFELAWPAITHFGLGFLVHGTWDPNREVFGALYFIYGTVLTSFGAVLIAGPISIAIGLYLSELAPRGIR